MHSSFLFHTVTAAVVAARAQVFSDVSQIAISSIWTWSLKATESFAASVAKSFSPAANIRANCKKSYKGRSRKDWNRGRRIKISNTLKRRPDPLRAQSGNCELQLPEPGDTSPDSPVLVHRFLCPLTMIASDSAMGAVSASRNNDNSCHSKRRNLSDEVYAKANDEGCTVTLR